MTTIFLINISSLAGFSRVQNPSSFENSFSFGFSVIRSFSSQKDEDDNTIEISFDTSTDDFISIDDSIKSGDFDFVLNRFYDLQNTYDNERVDSKKRIQNELKKNLYLKSALRKSKGLLEKRYALIEEEESIVDMNIRKCKLMLKESKHLQDVKSSNPHNRFDNNPKHKKSN